MGKASGCQTRHGCDKTLTDVLSFGVQNIQDGNGPKWKMFIQVMTDKQADEVPYDPFDLTKVWPHKEFPLHEVSAEQRLVYREVL